MPRHQIIGNIPNPRHEINQIALLLYPVRAIHSLLRIGSACAKPAGIGDECTRWRNVSLILCNTHQPAGFLKNTNKMHLVSYEIAHLVKCWVSISSTPHPKTRACLEYTGITTKHGTSEVPHYHNKTPRAYNTYKINNNVQTRSSTNHPTTT